MSAFSWPAYPTNDLEFESLMVAIDAALTAEGVKPFQRSMHVGRKFWEAFKWSGNVFPDKRLADLPGFDGDILMAKSYRWYEQMYGEKLKGDMAYGFAPARLGNAIWRVCAGVTYGTVGLFIDRNLANRGRTFVSGRQQGPASFNILCAVEGLPQGLADRLSEAALREHLEFHILMHEALQWRDQLPRTELVQMAHADYDESTSGVLAGRFGQARWAAEQSIEKMLKGLLAAGGTDYATRGPRGHSLEHAAKLLKEHHGVALNSVVLGLAGCSPAVRYGEVVSTEGQAVAANHAVLFVLDELRRSTAVAALIASATVSRTGS